LIDGLTRHGIRKIIVGSGSHALIVQDLGQTGMARYFDPGDIYGYEQTATHKPDPLVLQRPLQALDEEGIERDAIVCVGDSVRDYRVAKGNNVDFIAVLTGLESHEDFVKEGLADRYIASNLSLLRLWL
jgi:phosphoglycolate phosphatase-like HAD superfamily hydrolase